MRNDYFDEISIVDIKRRIEELSSADLVKLSDDEIKDRVARLIDQWPLPMRKLQLNGLYRARKNAAGCVFHNARELWYPPGALVTKPSRLNRAHQVRFYASSAPNTAILELRPQVGDVFTILIVRTKAAIGESLENIVFLGLERSLAPEVSHFSDAEYPRKSQQFRKNLGEANYEKWLLIDDYLSRIFGESVGVGEEHKYAVTSAFGDLLFSYPGLDAVNYPSVETADHGINICLLPEKADNLFVPAECWMVGIDGTGRHPDTGFPLFRVRFMKRSKSITHDGQIDWLPDGVGIDGDAIQRLARHPIKSLREDPSR